MATESNLELVTANISGKTRRETFGGREFIVAPMTMLVGGVFSGTGVYAIRNTVNGKSYIGSAAGSFSGRIREHLKCLKGNYHVNKHLQASWNKHGIDCFECLILEQCSPEECLAVEQKYLDAYFGEGKPLYNICPTAGSRLGTKLSPEACKRNGDRFRGKPLSQSQKDNISKAQTGSKRSEEARKRMKEAQGNPEARNRMRLVFSTPEMREKQRRNQTGKKHTMESRAKMSVARQGKPMPLSMRMKLSASKMGHTVSEETRRKISETLKARRVV